MHLDEELIDVLDENGEPCGWTKAVWSYRENQVICRYIENHYDERMGELHRLYPEGLPLDLSIHHADRLGGECDLLGRCTIVWLGSTRTRQAWEARQAGQLFEFLTAVTREYISNAGNNWLNPTEGQQHGA